MEASYLWILQVEVKGSGERNRNIEKKPDIESLKKRFTKSQEIKERNATISKAYKEGYSQHMIAKVLGLAQSTVNGIIKRRMK